MVILITIIPINMQVLMITANMKSMFVNAMMDQWVPKVTLAVKVQPENRENQDHVDVQELHVKKPDQ